LFRIWRWIGNFYNSYGLVIHGQWAIATPVAEDVEHVDHAADKVHDQHQEAVADDVVADAQGF